MSAMNALTSISPFCVDYGPRRSHSTLRENSIASKKRSLIALGPEPHVPIYFGGASDAAIRVGAKHSDVYALFGEPRAAIQQMMERIRTEAARMIGVHASISLLPDDRPH